MNSTIPECIGNNQALQRFVINDQPMIYGTIPDSICNLINLTIFKISDTSISGSIPNCISSLQNLTTFDLKNNNMFGNVPMLNSSKLTTVALNNNSLSDPLQIYFHWIGIHF